MIVRVKNWRKRQSYEGRIPQWIKLFRDLLNPARQPEYAALSDLAKLHLLHIWLLAAECEGDVPQTWINADRLNLKSKPRLQELVGAGFLCVMTPDMTNVMPHVMASVSDSDSPSDSFDVEEAFSRVWRDIIAAKVPKPVRKSLSERHFRASVKAEADLAALWVALRNYRASERVERGFVQDASTFLNQWRDWVESPDETPAPPDPNAPVDALREWALDRRGALDRGNGWPFDDVSREEFAAWLTWFKTARTGNLSNDDGTLNDLDAFRKAAR